METMQILWKMILMLETLENDVWNQMNCLSKKKDESRVEIKRKLGRRFFQRKLLTNYLETEHK